MPLSTGQFINESDLKSPILREKTLSRGSLGQTFNGFGSANKNSVADFGVTLSLKKEFAHIANRQMSLQLARCQSRDAMRYKNITPLKEGTLKHRAQINTFPPTPVDSNISGLRRGNTTKYHTSSHHLGGNYSYKEIVAPVLKPYKASNNKRHLISDEDVVPEALNPDREHSPIKRKGDVINFNAEYNKVISRATSDKSNNLKATNTYKTLTIDDFDDDVDDDDSVSNE